MAKRRICDFRLARLRRMGIGELRDLEYDVPTFDMFGPERRALESWVIARRLHKQHPSAASRRQLRNATDEMKYRLAACPRKKRK